MKRSQTRVVSQRNPTLLETWWLRLPARFTDASQKELDMNAHICMDMVVLERPSNDPGVRVNFVRSDETRVWRTVAEKDFPECHGQDHWKKQAPLARIVPLWGGLSANGFVLFSATHSVRPTRKIDSKWFGGRPDGGVEGVESGARAQFLACALRRRELPTS